MNRLLMLVALGGLGACTNLPVAPPAPEAKPDGCGAASLQGLIGQPEAVLRSAELPRDARVIGPRDAVTMDYRPTRLNFEIGADERIAKISCY